jgi:hypothetical protein
MRIMALTLTLALLAGGAGPALAEKRLMEEGGVLARSVWGTFAGFGFYTPQAPAITGGAQVTTGLRYIKPDREDATYHSVGYELAASSFSSSSQVIFSIDASILFYYPRTEIFSFDHHFYYGIGLGQATVTRPRRATIDVTQSTLTGGLQGRIRDWYLEAFFKGIGSVPNATFRTDGYVTAMQATYFFNP